jgi:hypothetical protein
VLVGNAAHALLRNQITALLVHGASLPLSSRFANADASVEVARDAVQMLDQLSLLRSDARGDPMETRVMWRSIRQ